MRDAFDELLDLLEEAQREGRLRVVFWTCPKGCLGFVDWMKMDDGLRKPKCRECGEEGKPR